MNKTSKFIFLLLCFFIIIIFLEIGVRIWGYAKHYIYDPIYISFRGGGSITYVHKPNLVNALGRGGAIFNTDSLGLRSKICGLDYRIKGEREYRIAVTGDSITFGEGIKETGDTYCEVLKEILNRKQNVLNVYVFNYGVSAYNVQNMADTLLYRMLDIEPDLVIVAIIPEDFDLERTGDVDRWGYTANKRLSGFMHKDSIIKLWVRKLHLVYLLRDIRFWIINKDKYTNNLAKEEIAVSYKYVLQFKDIAEKYEIPYLIVFLPCVDSPGEKLVSQFKKDNLNYLDLSSIYYEFKPDVYKADKFDYHPSAAVHKRIAKEIAEYIVAAGFLRTKLQTLVPGKSSR